VEVDVNKNMVDKEENKLTEQDIDTEQKPSQD